MSTHQNQISSVNTIEYTAIEVTFEKDKCIFFASIYKKPSIKIDANELSIIINLFNGTLFVIAGDFNCKHSFWGNADNSSEGNKLYNWLCDSIDTHNIKTFIPENNTIKTIYTIKTFIPCVRANSESILDLYFVDDSIKTNLDANSNKLSTHDFDSDYRAVALTVIINNKITNAETKTHYNWNKVNFDRLSKFIDSKLAEYYLPISCNIENDQIDTVITHLNEIFNTAIKKYVPCIEINQNSLITLSNRSLKLLREKKSARRKWFRNKNNQHANSLRTVMKLLSNMAYNSIVADYKSFWEHKFSELKADIFQALQALLKLQKTIGTTQRNVT